MANTRAGNNFQGTTALPYLKSIFRSFNGRIIYKYKNKNKNPTLSAISKFSEPHMSIASSYEPISKKNSRSIAKEHPICVGDRSGAVRSKFVRILSLCGTLMLKQNEKKMKKNSHQILITHLNFECT